MSNNRAGGGRRLLYVLIAFGFFCLLQAHLLQRFHDDSKHLIGRGLPSSSWGLDAAANDRRGSRPLPPHAPRRRQQHAGGKQALTSDFADQQKQQKSKEAEPQPQLLPPPPTFPPDERCGGRAVAAVLPPWHARSAADTASDGRPPWCLDNPAPSRTTPVYLASIIYVRIWPKEDLAELTTQDLAHWLTYSRYMGVERVYLYDTHHDDGESVLNDAHVKAGVDSGFVHYVDWQGVELGNLKPDGTRKKQHLNAVQGTAYAHVQRNYGQEARWMTFTDMDEYPYQLNDAKPGFLSRFLLDAEREQETRGEGPCERTTQFMMPNVLLEGGRGDLSKGPMLIQQATRLGKGPANNLVKQIVRLDAARSHAVHHSSVLFGRTTRLKIDDVTMKHAWGGRRHGWKQISEMDDKDREKLFRDSAENDNGGIDEQVLRCF